MIKCFIRLERLGQKLFCKFFDRKDGGFVECLAHCVAVNGKCRDIGSYYMVCIIGKPVLARNFKKGSRAINLKSNHNEQQHTKNERYLERGER